MQASGLVCSTKCVYDGSKRQPKVTLPPVLMAPASSDSSIPWCSKQKKKSSYTEIAAQTMGIFPKLFPETDYCTVNTLLLSH